MNDKPISFELSWDGTAYRVSRPRYLLAGERRKVVELEPMLELLEQLVTPMDTISAEDEPLKAAEALLCEHGRLEET